MTKSLLLKLEEKVNHLLGVHSKQKEEIYLLKEKNEFLNKRIKEFFIKITELEEKNKLLQVSNAMMGNKEYKKSMKYKINLLIRSIDQCIDQLKS